MTTTPIEIDPKVVEVAARVLWEGFTSRPWSEANQTEQDCWLGLAYSNLQSAAPLQREACAKIAQDWDEQNAVALEIAAAIRQRGGRA